MSAAFSSVFKKGVALLNSRKESSIPSSTLPLDSSFSQALHFSSLFPPVDPAVDGEDCDHDCASCEANLPKGWKIDEEEKLYGHINGWATHMLVATGKTDWVKDVADEKGSVMEAVGVWKKAADGEPENGKLMLSASNIPLPAENCVTEYLPPEKKPTTVLLLPAFMVIEGVTPATVPQLIEQYVATASTNTTPLHTAKQRAPLSDSEGEANGYATLPLAEETDSSGVASLAAKEPDTTTSAATNSILLTLSSSKQNFDVRPSPHRYLILLCSQRTRDARCGQSAPLLRREFERHLRPLGLYRDLHDERPGGVGIYFISHVGGHKFSANVMVYRRTDTILETEGKVIRMGNGVAHGEQSEKDKAEMGEASQCIWLARVRPEDCEGIIKFTVLQGKVVKPERQLRGGFDRANGLVSW